MADPDAIVSAGDPRHPGHEAFLLELGRATYLSARCAGICFDILRVYGGIQSAEMYDDPLGRLEHRLRELHAEEPNLPELTAFLDALATARAARNDLLHALPVKDGLHRRRTHDSSYVRSFFSVQEVAEASRHLNTAWQLGSRVLYADGGTTVSAWIAAKHG